MDPNKTPNQYYNPSTPTNRNPNTPPPSWFFNCSPMNPFLIQIVIAHILNRVHNKGSTLLLNTGSTLKRSKASDTDSPASSDARVQINLNDIDKEEDEIDDLTRPIERDRAKAERARAIPASSSQPIPDYTQGMDNLSQKIGDFNDLKRERQRLAELQLLFTNTDHLTGVDREIAEREKAKIRNKYKDN
ncbi:hypothetical protein R6Q59_034261 [Mikania micrantha]